MKKFVAILLSAVMLFSLVGCSGSGSAEHSFVKVTMETGDSFIIELMPEYAPETVENFLQLVESGFYDGLTFHRIFPGFMAQGGDPKGDGTGGSDKEIKGEFSSNGFTKNTLGHERGVVSMARSNDPDSASSQFFICYDLAAQQKAALDGNYAAFGKVIEGMETVDALTECERVYSVSDQNFTTPVDPPVMEKVEVIDYAPSK